MREIKFREWNGIEMNYNPMVSMISTASINERFLDNNIMQYIGLKDKNGKEIYERDIVELSKGHIVEIKFQDGGFGYQGMMGLYDFISFAGHNWLKEIQSRCKVLGNIYENSELKSQLNNNDE